MTAFVSSFEERCIAVQKYLRMLAAMETSPGTIPGKRRDAETNFRAMKATVFLMLYNVVEASIRSGFQYIYDDLIVKSATFSGTTQSIRELWVRQKFRSIPSESANHDTYFKVALDITKSILDEQALELSARKLAISGNLDDSQIRRLCQLHGVVPKIHHRAFGGGELSTVKTQRNALAHGHITFDECGRQYTVADLTRIHRQVCIFVRGVLKALASAVEKSSFYLQQAQ